MKSKEPEIQQLSDEEYLVDGGILLEDLNEELPLSLFSENYDTLSGYMIENLGYIPKENEQASVLAGEWQLRVEQVKDNALRGYMFPGAWGMYQKSNK